MTEALKKFATTLWPQFNRTREVFLSPYYTFHGYNQIWIMGIFALLTTALLPLIIITSIHYQLIQKSIDSEALLRTERLASNTRRAVTFFLEERLAALKFTINAMGYEALSDSTQLTEVLRNLKMGFGGLNDLSVIDHTGTQVTYAGPFDLEGKNYSRQPWFLECQKHNAYVSEVFSGHRGVPHIVVAVKSVRPNGPFFILRATLETERLLQTLSTYRPGEHAEIFLINHDGVLQTPSQLYRTPEGRVNLTIPQYSARTRAYLTEDADGLPIVVSYAFIDTLIAPTPFILMVVKQKAGMMKIWLDLHSNITWFVGFSAIAILVVTTLTATHLVNKIYLADHAKAKTMALAEQSNQLASIGQLAAGVAHEINNPLALINETAGYIKDLFTIKEEYRDDPELIENIDSILEAIDRCGTITRQLLSFARRFDLKVQHVNLKEAVGDVLNFHKKETEYRNIDIDVDVPDEIPPIETDRGKLQQILLNLINNAFQALDNGCSLQVAARMDGPERVCLTIQDTGCGIPKENLNKIFDPLFTTKSETEGTGLGLSITYALVKKLHGDIEVRSTEGAGTTFTVTLPVHPPKETRQ